jgi:hypothetical protein
MKAGRVGICRVSTVNGAFLGAVVVLGAAGCHGTRRELPTSSVALTPSAGGVSGASVDPGATVNAPEMASSDDGKTNGNESQPASVVGLTANAAQAGVEAALCSEGADACAPSDAGLAPSDAGLDAATLCPGCSIDGNCIAANEANPQNPCQICDPARDARAWSAQDGVTCDDGLYCTTNDVCTGGVCKGMPRQCEDGIACNGVSTCDEAAGKCTDPVNQCGANSVCDTKTDTCASTCTGCLVGGVCVAAGAQAAGNPCLVCNPSQSTTAYVGAMGQPCGAGPNACSQQDTCDAQGRCQPNDLPSGTPCGSSTSSTCDQPDTCDGKGTCDPRLATNGTPCDDGVFCTVGDNCQGGRCVPRGANTGSCGVGLICNTQAQCVPQPRCGDGIVNGNEACDPGSSPSTDLGSCNPECTGVYQKKFIKITQGIYDTNLKGPSGADADCQKEFDSTYKALLVGGGRRATVTPFAGDGQLDWVLHKYTHYFNGNGEEIWRTDGVALLGVRAGAKQPLLATLFPQTGQYPWGGYDASNWTTLPDAASQAEGTCLGWTSDDQTLYGDFVVNDLSIVASELCGSSAPLLCVQQ